MRDFIVSADIVEKWLTAWSLSRKLPLPVKFKSGFIVDVGSEKQKIRYVFPHLNEDFFQLSESIDEPWVFLNACAPPAEIASDLSPKWVVQPQGYMMSCFHLMGVADRMLPNEYKLELNTYNSTFVARIITGNGESASGGRLILIDDLAIYDRIFTDINHRRKGLAAFLMKELERIALSKGIFKNFLVATGEGRLLYESLGWELYGLYTSVVIPA